MTRINSEAQVADRANKLQQNVADNILRAETMLHPQAHNYDSDLRARIALLEDELARALSHLDAWKARGSDADNLRDENNRLKQKMAGMVAREELENALRELSRVKSMNSALAGEVDVLKAQLNDMVSKLLLENSQVRVFSCLRVFVFWTTASSTAG